MISQQESIANIQTKNKQLYNVETCVTGEGLQVAIQSSKTHLSNIYKVTLTTETMQTQIFKDYFDNVGELQQQIRSGSYRLNEQAQSFTIVVEYQLMYSHKKRLRNILEVPVQVSKPDLLAYLGDIVRQCQTGEASDEQNMIRIGRLASILMQYIRQGQSQKPIKQPQQMYKQIVKQQNEYKRQNEEMLGNMWKTINKIKQELESMKISVNQQIKKINEQVSLRNAVMENIQQKFQFMEDAFKVFIDQIAKINNQIMEFANHQKNPNVFLTKFSKNFLANQHTQQNTNTNTNTGTNPGTNTNTNKQQNKSRQQKLSLIGNKIQDWIDDERSTKGRLIQQNRIQAGGQIRIFSKHIISTTYRYSIQIQQTNSSEKMQFGIIDRQLSNIKIYHTLQDLNLLTFISNGSFYEGDKYVQLKGGQKFKEWQRLEVVVDLKSEKIEWFVEGIKYYSIKHIKLKEKQKISWVPFIRLGRGWAVRVFI